MKAAKDRTHQRLNRPRGSRGMEKARQIAEQRRAKAGLMNKAGGDYKRPSRDISESTIARCYFAGYKLEHYLEF